MKAKATAVSRKKSQRIGDDEISLFFISDLIGESGKQTRQNRG